MLRRGAKPHLPFSQVWQAGMWGQRRLSVYSNHETLRIPPEGCQATTPGPNDPELGFRGLEAKVGIPSQRKEEERATNSGQGRRVVWEMEPEVRKQASRERMSVWSVQRTVCLEGQVGAACMGEEGSMARWGGGCPEGEQERGWGWGQVT